MIKPNELDRNNVITHNNEQYAIERAKIENKFDFTITKYQLELLNGKEIKFTVHDSENQYNSLKDVVNDYRKEGWCIDCMRPWTALFEEISLRA